MEQNDLQRWTTVCLELMKQEQITKAAAVDRVCGDLAFQRSGISSMELFVSVSLASQPDFRQNPDG